MRAQVMDRVSLQACTATACARPAQLDQERVSSAASAPFRCCT